MFYQIVQKRILDRLADTPEFREAVKSASGRSRRSAVAKPSRQAARSASESIQQVVKDERSRVIVPKTEPKSENESSSEKKPELKGATVRTSPPKQPKNNKRKRPEKKSPNVCVVCKVPP